MSKHRRYRCRSCSQMVAKSSVARSWHGLNGRLWHICRSCWSAEVRGRELDEEAARAAERAQ